MDTTEGKIKRLKELDNKLWAGVITKEEDKERKRLRLELQQALSDEDASPPAIGGRGETYWVGTDGEAPVPIPRRRLSFKEAITKAEDQIGFHEYSRQHSCYGILHDMCRAMAEIYMMPPHAKVRINGEELEAEMVAEVLEQVTEDMAVERAEELLDVIADVTCLKAYLRSALYNKVFEFEAADVKEQAKKSKCSFDLDEFFNAAVERSLEILEKGERT